MIDLIKRTFCMARDLIVIGNWKMYKTSSEASDYIEKLIPLIEGCRPRVFLSVPYTAISSAVASSKKSQIEIGAQNMNDAREGAFTGEIAALMLKEAGASFVLLGHSERRRIFHESDELIEKKVKRALQDDLIPVLCVGETLEEHEEKETKEVLERQIESALSSIPKENISNLILAYEPVWAIGTGKSATPKQAQTAHALCREALSEHFGKRKAGQIPILYGGSVKPENAKTLMSQKDIDGVLVGGASLDPEVLANIIMQCEGIR